MRQKAENMGQVFICPYRSNGMVLYARIRARTVKEAARKMELLDWAPDCGPVGAPWSLASDPASVTVPTRERPGPVAVLREFTAAVTRIMAALKSGPVSSPRMAMRLSDTRH